MLRVPSAVPPALEKLFSDGNGDENTSCHTTWAGLIDRRYLCQPSYPVVFVESFLQGDCLIDSLDWIVHFRAIFHPTSS